MIGETSHRDEPSDRDEVDAIADVMKPGARASVKAGSANAQELREAARSFVARFHPDARFAVIFGSALRGNLRPFSDVDIVIVERQVEFAQTCRRMHEGVPIEAHVVDAVSLNFAIEAVKRTAVPNLLFGMAEGSLLCGDEEAFYRLQERIKLLISEGPRPLSLQQRELARRNLSVRLFDLLETADRAERQALAEQLVRLMYLVHFGRQGQWRYNGKWAVRADPSFAARLTRAVDAVLSDSVNAGGGGADLIALASQEIGEWGGFVWERSDTILWPGELKQQAPQVQRASLQ
jgi:predicted nucleotidyltransferase